LNSICTWFKDKDSKGVEDLVTKVNPSIWDWIKDLTTETLPSWGDLFNWSLPVWGSGLKISLAEALPSWTNLFDWTANLWDWMNLSGEARVWSTTTAARQEALELYDVNTSGTIDSDEISAAQTAHEAGDLSQVMYGALLAVYEDQRSFSAGAVWDWMNPSGEGRTWKAITAAQLEALELYDVNTTAIIDYDEICAAQTALWAGDLSQDMYDFLFEVYENQRSFAAGGAVSETGMALVHEGEYVIPKSGTLVKGAPATAPSNNMDITINLTVHNGTQSDSRALASEVSRLISSEIKRLVKV
jgi:regulator of sigma D